MASTTDFSFDVFLSHNAKDKPQVRRLAERLRDAGLRVWFDDWIIQPGDDIYLAIEHGLEDSRALILCLSPYALASDWVGLERSTVLFRDPSNKGRRFIPLLLADCELPDALRRYKYVDFREEADDAFGELLGVFSLQTDIQKHYGSTSFSLQLIYELSGHGGWITGIAIDQDCQLLLTSSVDGTVRLWDIKRNNLLCIFRGHTDIVNTCIIGEDGVSGFSVGEDGKLMEWDLYQRSIIRCYEIQAPIKSVVQTDDGQLVIIGDSEGYISVLDIDARID